MKRGICLLLILLSFSIYSCSKDDDNSTDSTVLAGNWSGSFTGDETGTWSATISESGIVSGTIKVTKRSIESKLNGNVSSDGRFTATAGTTSLGYNFDGQLKGNSGSGTWKNSSVTQSGNWSGIKK